ncbi:MAG: cysteine synthase A [Granulosicoccus sp.]|nr:cysteine synthase A [Granulosicoccus sp.]
MRNQSSAFAECFDTDTNRIANSAIPRSGITEFHQNERPDGQRRHANILSTIGHTPVVRVNRLAPAHVNMFVKIEAFNPLGSVKDRLALGIIEAAERDGSLQPGQTVIEATSGNTGIGLAMVCAQKGYPLVVTMAENFSVERRRLMRYLGAKVVLTPASEMGSGMLAKAVELADQHGWFLCRQFENEANADIHSLTTAPEILGDFPDHSLDYFVSGYGTGGTLKGIARVLRKKSPSTRIIATEPDNSPVLASGIKQEYTESGAPSSTHPMFRPHLMQGWAPDFISRLTTDTVDQELIDEITPVAGKDALRLARALAQEEGIFCGISGGATLAGALAIAERAEPGANILCMLPDTGERYLSTPLFEDIAVEMSEEEMSISQTTPGYRFDAPPAAPEEEPEAEQAVLSPAATEFVEAVINSKSDPVVMFSLEWCEFCWSVRKLFAKLGIAYKSIDLDSVDYQQNNWGGEIRTVLEDLTQAPTIPQIFVGGQHIGGCTETFDAFIEGSLQQLFDANDIAYARDSKLEPYSLLPSWLHPR